MAQTIVGLNDPKARKLWSADLMVSVSKQSYWTRKMMGKGSETSMPVMLQTDLEQEAGDTISYDLSVQLSGGVIEGDQKARARARSSTSSPTRSSSTRPVSRSAAVDV